MFHILGFLFIIIIAILIIGLSIIGTVLRRIFGLGKRRNSSQSYQNSGRYQQPRSTQSEEVRQDSDEVHSKRKKLFSEDEGEYVDFEEIKE